MKKIFLDYDNTLAHSLYASSEIHADQLLYDYSEHFVGAKFNVRVDGWYVTFKRPWCDDLLTFTRQLVGPNNVYILTASTEDYVRWCNKCLNLGFNPNTNIYAREDVHIRNTHPYKKFKDTFNVLVDNLTYDEHAFDTGKISFLNNIPEAQYVKVTDFTVWSEPLNNKTEFESVSSKIITALNL